MTAIVQALVANAQTTIDLTWAMQWLDSLVDDLNTEHHERTGDEEHHRTREFLDDLATRRKNSETLHAAAREAEL